MTQHSGYSGFLDGYKAQNLESVASAANFHVTQINDLISKVSSRYPGDAKPSFLKEMPSVRFKVTSLMAMGEALKTILAYARASDKELLTQNEFKLLIYHYMEAAKLSSDNNVIDLALEIGEQASV